MSQKLIAANWKMNGSLSANEELVRSLLDLPSHAEQVICPPAVYLTQVQGLLAGSDVCLGAQNVDWRSSGAVSGEISAEMVRDIGGGFVIVGHSERRAFFAEDDELCCKKVAAVMSAGLTPILCVGETKQQRDEGETLSIVEFQVTAGLSNSLENMIIAYEPVWAIGTGDSATPEQASEVHSHIRQVLKGIDEAAASEVRILYGGSVNAENAASLFAMKDIDGALVGGASLSAKEFSAICCAG